MEKNKQISIIFLGVIIGIVLFFITTYDLFDCSKGLREGNVDPCIIQTVLIILMVFAIAIVLVTIGFVVGLLGKRINA